MSLHSEGVECIPCMPRLSVPLIAMDVSVPETWSIVPRGCTLVQTHVRSTRVRTYSNMCRWSSEPITGLQPIGLQLFRLKLEWHIKDLIYMTSLCTVRPDNEEGILIIADTTIRRPCIIQMTGRLSNWYLRGFIFVYDLNKAELDELDICVDDPS